jgi:predicted O-methyltransferase YrrM
MNFMSEQEQNFPDVVPEKRIVATQIERILPTNEENACLSPEGRDPCFLCEMSIEERAFLNALVLRNRPQKLLEVGVSAGGSSCILLDAIRQYATYRLKPHLYAIDYLDYYYKDPMKKCGWLVDEYWGGGGG